MHHVTTGDLAGPRTQEKEEKSCRKLYPLCKVIMASLTGQGIGDKALYPKFPRTIPILNLSGAKKPNYEDIKSQNSERVGYSTKWQTQERLATNEVLHRRGSGTFNGWTNPLESSANPVIISTHPNTPRSDVIVAQSDSQKDAIKQTDLFSSPEIIPGVDSLLPQSDSSLHQITVETGSSAVPYVVGIEEDALISSSNFFTNSLGSSSRAPETDDIFVLEKFGSEFCRVDSEKDDPVVTILLKVLQQLEQEKCAEMERIRREKQNYRDTLRRQRKPRARQRKMLESSNDDVPVSGANKHLKLFRQMKVKMEKSKSLGLDVRQNVAGTNGYSSMADRLKNITKSDIVLPEYADWLFDQSSNEKVWCVVADMLFCIFENKTSELPKSVVILPGCTVKSLVYHTPSTESSNIVSKTVTGIDRYQIIIDESGTKKKHSFSVETKSEIQKWMSFLRPATKLDNDIEYEPSRNDPRRHSLCGPLPSSENCSDQMVTASCNANVTTEANRNSESPTSDGKPSVSTLQMDSLGEFRRKLRRETDNEVIKPQPVKATHFQHTSVPQKKPGAFKRLRSFGSLDNIFKRRSNKGTESPDSQSLEGSDDGSFCPSVDSSADFSPSVPSGNADDLHRPRNRRLSRSLDYGKSEKGLSKGLFRTASDLKERLKRNKPECNVKLLSLNDIRMSGYLQQKFLLKWQKLWCVVSRGCLYGFKSQSPEDTASLAVVLTNCTITYVSDQDKRYKKLFVFKLSQHNKKSVYLNACDNDDLSDWLQCLQMEACKVQIDVESKDSVDTCDSAYSSSMSTHSRSSPSSPRGDNSPRISSESDLPSHDIELENARRYSCPTWTEFKGDLIGSDPDLSSSNDEWGNSSFPGTNCGRNPIGFPTNDFPEHDQALKHVWEKDRNYLFNLVRAKLRAYRKRREGGSYTDKEHGPNNEDLILVTDEKLDLKRNKFKNGGSRQVRRTRSFNIKPASISGADVMTSQAEIQKSSPASPLLSPHRTKRHKPLVVKKLAARDIEEPTLCGYLERRSFSEQWMRYWYVLQGSSLFCYLTPDDNVTVDILDLQGYSLQCLIDQFRGKRFVLELVHLDIMSTHLSADSRDEMQDWEHCIQAATGQPPSPQAVSTEVFPDDSNTKETYEDKCVSVKKKLLQEMLRQKHELEKKQAARLRRSEGGPAAFDSGLSSEEKQISYATNLRQRRLSTQIKMDTIQKQIQETTPSVSKRFFNFGGKKKVQQKDVQHLEGQLKELNTKLQQIDQDLTSHINKSSGESLDLNQNRKTNVTKTLSEPLEPHINDGQVNNKRDTTNKEGRDINRTNSLNIKSSVQKLAQKTFSKSVKNKSKTLNGSSQSDGRSSELYNGYSSDSQLWNASNEFTQNGEISYEDESEEGSVKSDSLTDLTSTKSPASDNVFDLSSSLNGGSSSPRLHCKASDLQSTSSTPRKEVHPNIMAEIDAFEDFTKQVLSARMAPT